MDVISYDWIKALHIMSVLAWMAGLFYLPRLYVYHAEAETGGELSETLKIMERRLLKAIMAPAMIATWVFGLIMFVSNELWQDGWMHAKLVLVILMTVMHFMMGKWRVDFLNDVNQRSHKFYRMMNEVPTILMIFIVILVIIKPF